MSTKPRKEVELTESERRDIYDAVVNMQNMERGLQIAMLAAGGVEHELHEIVRVTLRQKGLPDKGYIIHGTRGRLEEIAITLPEATTPERPDVKYEISAAIGALNAGHNERAAEILRELREKL